MDEKIDRLIALRKIRDDANAEIASIFGGAIVPNETKKREVNCSHCGLPGHTARKCPSKAEEITEKLPLITP